METESILNPSKRPSRVRRSGTSPRRALGRIAKPMDCGPALVRILLSLTTLLTLGACTEGEVAWETTTSAVGAVTSEQVTADTKWRSYRVRVVSALDEMTRTLESTQRQASVADRAEVDQLRARIDRLRGEMIAELDEDPEAAPARRVELRASFDRVVKDIDRLLIRLGHSREEFGAWHASE